MIIQRKCTSHIHDNLTLPPNLTVRVDGFKKPICRIILDTNLILDRNAKLVKTIRSNPLIIFTNKNLDKTFSI